MMVALLPAAVFKKLSKRFPNSIFRALLFCGRTSSLNPNQYLTWSHEVFGAVALVLMPFPSLTGDYIIIMASEAMTVEAPAQALGVKIVCIYIYVNFSPCRKDLLLGLKGF